MTTPTWLKVDGTWEKNDAGYRMTNKGGNGSFDLKTDDVRFEDGSAQVRLGAIAVNTRHPTKIDKSQAVQALGEKTYCIAFELFRCSDHQIIGGCVGAWDCS